MESSGDLIKQWYKKMDKNENLFLWRRFTLREGILLGFCATFIVITRAGLRIKINMPGHAMFFMMFFLLLAYGCVPKRGAATLVGLISGLVSMLLGMGKGGPLILLKFILPAVVVEIGGIIFPQFLTSYIACVIIGIIVSAVRVVTVTWVEWLVGMEKDILMQKIFIMSITHAIFACLGSVLVPSVVRRLRAHRLLEK